jgi:hypothetical protein
MWILKPLVLSMGGKRKAFIKGISFAKDRKK